MISNGVSLARVRLLAPTRGSSLLSTRLAVHVDRWATLGGGTSEPGNASSRHVASLWVAGLATLAGQRHIYDQRGRFNVSIVRTTSRLPLETAPDRRHLSCSSCGCGITGRDTDEAQDVHDDDDIEHEDNDHQHYDDNQRGRSDLRCNLASRANNSSSTPRLRLPGSSGSSSSGSVFSDKTAREAAVAAAGQDESIKFRSKSPLVTLFDSSTHASARKQRRSQPGRFHLKQQRQQQQQQHQSRDLFEEPELSCSHLKLRRRLRERLDHQQDEDNNQVWGPQQVPYRATSNPRNSVMVKPDPERRSVVHIVKSPSSRSQQSQSPRPVVTVVDEEQLHRRFLQSVSERGSSAAPSDAAQQQQQQQQQQEQEQSQQAQQQASQPRSGRTHLNRDRDRSVSSSTSSGSNSDSLGLPVLSRTRAAADNEPPPAAIIIPPSVARSLSMRRQQPSSSSESRPVREPSAGGPRSPDSQSSAITREQLEYGPLLRPNEVQVLYRSPETFGGGASSSLGLGSISSMSSTTDRQTRDDQIKQVVPHQRQSPIALMSMNPAYEVHSRPLILEYPATVENLRMNNTGFSWEVKIPYQLSASTSLSGAHLAPTQRFRLDQFHCHWGDSGEQGSEHTIDNRHYSAEMHFVHYNMEKYHTMSKAARHPDGLVVVGVLIDAQPTYHNHAELEKVVTNLKSIQLKGEHSYIKQVLRIDNLLPANRSYWSYPGSLTTPPYLESVTWFVLKQPIKCNTAQIERFRNIKSTIRHDDDDRAGYIRSNFRKTQPLYGRTILTYDEPAGGSRS